MKVNKLASHNSDHCKTSLLKIMLTTVAVTLLLSSVFVQTVSTYGMNWTETSSEKGTLIAMNKNVSIPSDSSGSASQMSMLTETETDKFGVQMVYPAKPGGQEWYMNMVNPRSDGRFDPQDQITKNPDGSWKIRSDKVRMHVYTTNGYNPYQVTSDSGLSKVAARGFMGTSLDWKDVEITGYVKLNEFTENDNFVWYSRGGKHTDSDQCQGSAYKGNLFYHGETQFSKEQWHVSYAKSPTVTATSSLEGKWIGFKFVMFNFVSNDGKPAVKLENWINTNSDGKNWVKVYEGGDSGKWGRSGQECQVKADQIQTWGGPIATFRWDFAKDVDFRNFSVREITGENGTVTGINYFTGTSTSSNVPKFGNSIAYSDVANPQNVLSNDGRNKLANNNLANRSMTLSPSPSSTTSNYWNNNPDGESFDQQQVSSGSNVYVLWVRGDEDNTDLYLKISHDGGKTFGQAINLSNNPASLSYHPKVVASGENVYVVWEDDDGNSENSDIFFMKSSDAGKSFGGKTNLSNDPTGSGTPQLSVSDGNVYVVWTGTSPDSTDIFLAQSSNEGNSFTEPENLSNDPDISFNPVLSVNGTHVNVEWTDQDDNGFTKIKNKAVPNIGIGQTSQVSLPSYADVQGNLNSTDSSSDISLARNNTNTYSNSSKTEAGTLNQSSITPYLDVFVPGSNSSSSDASKSKPPQTTSTNGSKLENNTNTIQSDDPATLMGKPITNKVRGQIDVAINGTLYDPVKTSGLSHADPAQEAEAEAEALLENMTAKRLAVLMAAENALKATEMMKMESITSSSEQGIPSSAIEEQNKSTRTQLDSQDKEQIQSGPEAVAGTQQDTAPSVSSHPQDKLMASTQSEQVEVVKESSFGNINEQEKLDQQQQRDKVKPQQKKTQQSQAKENTVSVQDKAVEAAPTTSNLDIKNRVSSESSDRTHTEEEIATKKAANHKVQKTEDRQKTIHEKRLANSDDAREQKQKNEARVKVQNMIDKADKAFNVAERLIEEAKLANQKAQDTSEAIKSLQIESQKDQLVNNDITSLEQSRLINEAKISDQMARNAIEKYNDLRKAAGAALEEFTTRFR